MSEVVISNQNISKIWIITIFPEYFEAFLKSGIAAQAFQGKRGNKFEVNIVDLREHTFTKYKGVDDSPYGGGPGMVMRADVLKNALVNGVAIPGGYGESFKDKLHVIYPGPRGKVLNNDYAKSFANKFWGNSSLNDNSKDLVFVCGRYEGIDERFLSRYVDEEISLGDFVLTGGELAVLTILDSAVRFVPGALGNKHSAELESFNNGLIEHPQYTKPRDFEGMEVPDVLLSGHHKNIDKYQLEESIRITKKFREDLYDKHKKLKG